MKITRLFLLALAAGMLFLTGCTTYYRFNHPAVFQAIGTEDELTLFVQTCRVSGTDGYHVYDNQWQLGSGDFFTDVIRISGKGEVSMLQLPERPSLRLRSFVFYPFFSDGKIYFITLDEYGSKYVYRFDGEKIVPAFIMYIFGTMEEKKTVIYVQEPRPFPDLKEWEECETSDYRDGFRDAPAYRMRNWTTFLPDIPMLKTLDKVIMLEKHFPLLDAYSREQGASTIAVSQKLLKDERFIWQGREVSIKVPPFTMKDKTFEIIIDIPGLLKSPIIIKKEINRNKRVFCWALV